MTKPFVLAHVSDLHVSSFGDTFHDRSGLVRRSARLADTSPSRFDVAWSEAGWRVLRERSGGRARTSLVDPGGYAHAIPKATNGIAGDPVERAVAQARRLEARR